MAGSYGKAITIIFYAKGHGNVFNENSNTILDSATERLPITILSTKNF